MLAYAPGIVGATVDRWLTDRESMGNIYANSTEPTPFPDYAVRSRHHRFGMSAMFKKRRFIYLIASFLVGIPFLSGSPKDLWAQSNFPSRTVRIVTPFAAGAASDIELRALADIMSSEWHVPVVVENQPGTGGMTAAKSVLNAPADGYTIAFVGNNTAVAVSLFARPFDPRRDMTPVVGISEFAYLFVVNANSKYQTLQDFIAAAKNSPGALNVGTSSVGTSDHLIALLFKSNPGLDFAIVPYRGGPSELTVALLRNDIDMFVNAYGSLRQMIADKRMRALATTNATRTSELPEVPTMKESGVDNFEVTSWNGFYVPNGVPMETVNTIARTVSEILSRREVQKRFDEIGFKINVLTADALDRRMRSDIDRWAKVLADAGGAKQ
jgi:tripartite-type tricarboxylate transporter receptor subunit TctC